MINSLKREELIALNAPLLHELYFASMAFGDGKPTELLAQVLNRDFGSVDRWRREFVAMAKGLAGGSGWVLLVYVPRDRRLVNQYASDHHVGCKTAIALREAGFDAKYMRGGHSAWKAIGGPIKLHVQ